MQNVRNFDEKMSGKCQECQENLPFQKSGHPVTQMKISQYLKKSIPWHDGSKPWDRKYRFLGPTVMKFG